MKRYGRIQDGIVAELFETNLNITTLFSPDLLWVEIVDQAPVSEGWRYAAGMFTAPEVVSFTPANSPTIADLQAEIQHLAAQLAALSQHA